MAMVKARPNVVLVPNLPDRGVQTDLSWLKDSLPRGGAAEAPGRQRPIGPRRRQRSAFRRATWRR